MLIVLRRSTTSANMLIDTNRGASRPHFFRLIGKAGNMKRSILTLASMALCVHLSSVFAAEVEVLWIDPTCGYFAVGLPESDEPEKFGLFSARGLPLPKVGDRLEGNMTEIETQLENISSGKTHTVIHWADAKLLEQLVRNTPVQCASKWKNRKKR